MFRSAYHRLSDDSVSSFGGHPSLEAALAEAKANLKDPDIDHTWVRGASGAIIWHGWRGMF